MTNIKTKIITSAYCVAVSIAIMSCASMPRGKTDLLDFLRIGQTTRQDVYDHLGSPSRRYEEVFILTYRIARDRGGLFTEPYTKEWEGVRFSLVLAFDESGLLRKYAMVPIRFR
jgi:hypothetical protein